MNKNVQFSSGHYLEVTVPDYFRLYGALKDLPYANELNYSCSSWFFILDVHEALEYLEEEDCNELSSGEWYLIVLFKEILFRRKGTSVSALIGLA